MKVSAGNFADVVLATNAKGQISSSVVPRKEEPKLPKPAKKRVATR